MKEQKVMFAVSELKIMTAKHLLESAGIEAHSIDKRDSAHAAAWGDIELFVDESRSKEARQLLWDEGIL